MPDTPPTPPEKLSERLEIRLHLSAKQRFLAACRRAGDTPSDVLRAAMKGYVETVEAAEQPNLTKELSMKLIHNPLKTLAALGTSIAAAVMFTASPSIADDRDAQPLNPPYVVYPSDMITQNIEAECKAIMEVSVEGTPENISAECTHPGFIHAVIEAAATVKFAPKILDGKPVRRKGVEYPIIFAFSDDAVSFADLDKNSDGFLSQDEGISQGYIDVMDANKDGRASQEEYDTFSNQSQ